MRLVDIDALSHEMYHMAFETDSDMQKWDGGCWIRYKMFEKCRNNVPIIEIEPLTDGEQRIFLSAMGREEKVCKEFDDQIYSCYDVSLVRVCHEIKRKVKAALWEGETNNGK